MTARVDMCCKYFTISPNVINVSCSTKLDAEKRLAMQEEKQTLEAKLLEVPKMRARLAELKEAAALNM
jgi:hypothetical protein